MLSKTAHRYTIAPVRAAPAALAGAYGFDTRGLSEESVCLKKLLLPASGEEKAINFLKRTLDVKIPASIMKRENYYIRIMPKNKVLSMPSKQWMEMFHFSVSIGNICGV